MTLETLFALFKLLPSLIALVEQIFPQTTTGAEKAKVVTSLVNTMLPAVATTLQAAPAGQAHLATAISAVVSGMNAAGLMPTAGALATNQNAGTP